MKTLSVDRIAGTTITPTWKNVYGVEPTRIFSELLNSKNLLVSSMTGVSSGAAHYYSMHRLPSGAGLNYTQKWHAWINSREHISAMYIRAVDPGA